ncbi:hypothetical protein SOVF_000210 [Spinacia oleracea]|nr:hypothetical protein SOVF_000210 [Spinacia oleracea]
MDDGWFIAIESDDDEDVGDMLIGDIFPDQQGNVQAQIDLNTQPVEARFDLNTDPVEAQIDLNTEPIESDQDLWGLWQPEEEQYIPAQDTQGQNHHQDGQAHTNTAANAAANAAAQQGSHPRERRLSNPERLKILIWLLERKVAGKLIPNSINLVADTFNTTRQTISRLWNRALRQRQSGQDYEQLNKKMHRG